MRKARDENRDLLGAQVTSLLQKLMAEQGVTPKAMAAKLQKPLRHVTKILDPKNDTELRDLSDAFLVLGRAIDFSFVPKVDGILNSLREASEGLHGNNQQRIAIEGMKWLDLLLRKNRDYGSSVWNSPVLQPSLPAASAIMVRMSDKVNRIAQLTTNEPSVTSESLEDSVRDLGAYCLLYLARPRSNQ